MQPRKPKILFLTTSFSRSGDDDSAWLNHLALCTEMGFEHSVVAPHGRESLGFEELRKVMVYRFQYFFPKSLQRLAYEGGLVYNLSKSLFAWVQLPFFMLSFFAKAARQAKGTGLVFAMFLPSGIVALLLKKLYGKPYIFWVQRMVFGKGLLRRLNLAVLNNASFVLFNSSYVQKKALAETNLAAQRVVHMGVDLKKFKPGQRAHSRKAFDVRQRLGLPKNTRIVFGVGRFVEKKGFEYLIEAMGLVKAKGTVCCIAGFGNPREEARLKEHAKAHGVGDRVFFLGGVANSDLPFFLNQVQVVVVPSIIDSRGETETLGIVAIEAIACGRPVIASAVGGLVDVVKDGFNGFLVEQKSTEQIAEKADLLLKDKLVYSRLSRNALQLARQHFSEQRAAQDIVEVYKKAAR